MEKKSDLECWAFNGSKNWLGYGVISVQGKKTYAHRFSMMIFLNRQLLNGEIVMHKCNNPKCCNPYHLKVGTILENNRQKIEEGRARTNSRKKKLTYEEVMAIKQAIKMGHGSWNIASRFSIHPQTVRDIKNGKTHSGLKYRVQITQEPDPFEDE